MLHGRRDEKPVEINGGKRSNSSFITALLLLLSISPLLSSTTGLFTTITDLWLRDSSLKTSSYARIDTFGLSPSSTSNSFELLVLVTLEALGTLLHDLLGLDKRS